MPPSSLNSGHVALDRAATVRLLTPTPDDLADALGAIYLRGSVASASTATALLRRAPPAELGLALRALPPAVPPRTAPALALLTARIDSIALRSFAFAGEAGVRAGVQASLAEIDFLDKACDSSGVVVLFGRLQAFVGAVFSGGAGEGKWTLLAGLGQRARRMEGPVRNAVVALLIETCLERCMGVAEVEDDLGDVRGKDGGAFVRGVISEVGGLLDSEGHARRCARAVLLRTLEGMDAQCVLCFANAGGSWATKGLCALGRGNVAFVLAVVSIATSAYGDLAGAEGLMRFLGKFLQQGSVDSSVFSFVDVAAVTIGSLASVGFVGDAAEVSSAIRTTSRKWSKALSVDSMMTIDGEIQSLLDFASRRKFGRSCLCLGLLKAMRERWGGQTCDFVQWYEQAVLEIVLAIPSESKDDIAANVSMAGSLPDKSRFASCRAETENESDQQVHMPLSSTVAWSACVLPQLVAMVCVVGLWHHSSAVRYAAIAPFAKIPSSPAAFLFSPALLTRLSAENNGAVATFILRKAISASYIMRDKAASRSLVSAIITLMATYRSTSNNDYDRAAEAERNSSLGFAPPLSLPVEETCLGALSVAACINPSAALPALLTEVERVNSCFDQALPSMKVAAVVAALEVILARPSRGPSFVPLIQKCILADGEGSAALSIHAMHSMAVAGVLDTAKALKFALKGKPDPLDPEGLSVSVRRAYISLLGASSGCASSRKGRATTAKSIRMLRQGALERSPIAIGTVKSGACLSWEEVRDIGRALSEFEIADVLRIEFEGDDQKDNASEETDRVNAIEECVAGFIGNLVEVAGHSWMDLGVAADDSFSLLLRTAAANEWDLRPRSKFDSERLAKLRAASDALRRARLSKGNFSDGKSGKVGPQSGTQSVSNEDVYGEFLSATEKLPIGGIRTLCAAAAKGISTAAGVDIESSKFVSASALRALMHTGALSPVLPWPRLLLQLIQLNVEPAASAAVAAMYELPRNSYLVSELHKDVFDFLCRDDSQSVECLSAMAAGAVRSQDADTAEKVLNSKKASAPVVLAAIAALSPTTATGNCSEALAMYRLVTKASLRLIGDDKSGVAAKHSEKILKALAISLSSTSFVKDGSLASLLQLASSKSRQAILAQSGSTDAVLSEAGYGIPDFSVCSALFSTNEQSRRAVLVIAPSVGAFGAAAAAGAVRVLADKKGNIGRHAVAAAAVVHRGGLDRSARITLEEWASCS